MKRKGAAVVEFAVVLPLFVLLTLGMLELGRMTNVQQVLVNASREGARMAAKGEAPATIEAAINLCLTDAAVYGWRNGEIVPCTDAIVTVSPDPRIVSGGTPVTVSVELDRTKVSWVQNQFVTRNPSATTTFRKESLD